jgi:hypothetical protein
VRVAGKLNFLWATRDLEQGIWACDRIATKISTTNECFGTKQIERSSNENWEEKKQDHWT